MSAHVMTTALPRSLEQRADVHLTAFVTHKLEATQDSTLADFPAVATWVKTLGRGSWLVSASTLPRPVPATMVSEPSTSAWSSMLPSTTLVRGFPTDPPVVAAPWQSYRAHAMDEIAGYLHMTAILTSPLARPRADNLVAREVLRTTSEVHRSARRLLSMLDENPDQERVTKAMQDAAATLSGQPLRREHDNTDPPRPPDNAINALVRSQAEDEQRLTDWLDDLVAQGSQPGGMLGVLTDLHAARRYYQRPEDAVPYEPVPIEGATTPKVDNEQPDFHQLAASAGSTPALLRALGLAVDLTVERQHLAALEKATWVSVRFVPDDQDDLDVTDPPRTGCHVLDGVWQATSSGEWVGGRLPVGDAERYALLSLDPDATGLSAEQNLRNAIGEIASHLNGDKANGSPTALRATGFSLARLDRVETTRTRLQAASSLDGSTDPLLGYDEIVRGVRLHVRDGEGPWRSLHRRRVDVLAPDGQTVLADVPDSGYLPLTTLSKSGSADVDPYYLHEVFAGWDGWSLSAPRPGKIVVHAEDGSEQLLDEPPAPEGDDALGRVRSRVEPGSLPRLRYGHSYAFRAVGVDLAGGEIPDSKPDRVGPDAPRGARRRHPAARRRATTLGDTLRTAVATPSGTDAPAERPSRPPLADALRDVAGETVVMSRARVSATERLLTELVERGTRAQGAVSDLDRVRDAVVGAARQLDDLYLDPSALGQPNADPKPPEDDTTTDLVPFLRWHPVPPPTLVARHELTPGESLQRLVIREETTSERHVAPAKTTQLEAELHSKLDDAIGSTDPAAQRTAYAISLRERGTLLDQWIPDLDNPGATVEQQQISLATRPGADPEAVVTLEQITENRDTPLGEGQYVVHGVEQLVLPYLPDPLAAGLALVFLDAGAPHTLPEPRVLSAVVVPFAGDWPRVEPLRLVLRPGETLGAAVQGNVVTVSLPAGEQVRVAMSSSLRAEDLHELGLWRVTEMLLGAVSVEAVDLLRRAATSGWTWWLTPAEELRLVHATPRPARRPAVHDLAVYARPVGSTVAALLGITEVHGASTARLSLEASWSEIVDDVATTGPVEVARLDVPVRSQVREDERYGLLAPWDDPKTATPLHRAIQMFADTHHRTISYTLIGSTRYSEFFSPSELPGEDDPESRSDPVVLTIPSSARPAAPVVLETVPLILWEDGTEPDQPFARRRTRRSGVRIWMARPWYSSGDGELLGVVLGDALPHSASSRWGRDPGLLSTAEVASSGLPPLLASPDLLFMLTDAVAEPGTPADVPQRPGGPAQIAPPQRLVDLAEKPSAAVIGYEVEYNWDRELWFADVALDVADQMWPFVRLAVARYQPDSLVDCSLSPVVMTDWTQPLPQRTATVSRPDAGTVHVTVTGPSATFRRFRGTPDTPPFPGLPEPIGSAIPVTPLDIEHMYSRVFVATVQERGPSDLEWVDHAKVRLPAVGRAPGNQWQITWSERLELPEEVALATPGTSEGPSRYRVLIEEFEIAEADADPAPETPNRLSVRPVARLVYADTFDL